MVAAPAQDPGDETRVRRLLVVFDPAFENLSAMDALASLAARLHAELAGLFVEDSDLLRLGGNPLAGAVSRFSGLSRALDEDVLRRAMKVQMATLRAAVEKAARARRVRSSFEIRQGRLAAEVLASSEAADLVVVDWSCGDVVLRSAAGGSRTRPSATARSIAESAGRPVLLLRRGTPLGGPILVAYDGGPQSEMALEMALGLAGDEGGDLEIVFLTSSLAKVAEWQVRVAERLSGHDFRIDFLQMPHAGLEDLFREARRRHASLLVLEAGLPFLEGQAAAELLARMDCSVLLVR